MGFCIYWSRPKVVKHVYLIFDIQNEICLNVHGPLNSTQYIVLMRITY